MLFSVGAASVMVSGGAAKCLGPAKMFYKKREKVSGDEFLNSRFGMSKAKVHDVTASSAGLQHT